MGDTDIMRFALEIKLGNYAVSDGRDLAAVLRQIADRIEDDGPWEAPVIVDTVLTSGITDANGNTVGEWAIQNLSRQQATARTAFTGSESWT